MKDELPLSQELVAGPLPTSPESVCEDFARPDLNRKPGARQMPSNRVRSRLSSPRPEGERTGHYLIGPNLEAQELIGWHCPSRQPHHAVEVSGANRLGCQIQDD